MRLYTDIDPFVCEVLRARVADGGLLAGTVIEQDVTTLDPRGFTQIHLFCGIGGIPLGLQWAGWPEDWSIVTGGFPCQDVSVAGKGLGVEKGARSGLWKEMHRVIDLVRPTWVLAENVPALRTRGADRVLGDLEALGYSCWPLVVGAEHVGAPHRRHRVWIVAHGDGNVQQRAGAGRGSSRRSSQARYDAGGSGRMAVAIGAGRRPRSREQGDEGSKRSGRSESAGGVQLADTGHGNGQRLAEGPQEQPARSGRVGQRSKGLADTTSGGLGADGRARGGDGHADERGQNVVHSTGKGLEGFGADTGQSKQRERGRAGTPMRWPAPPGPYQHEWEAPRLIESGVGQSVDGLPRRVAGYLRRSGLKALGNAVVPQVVEIVARGMIAFGTNHQA